MKKITVFMAFLFLIFSCKKEEEKSIYASIENVSTEKRLKDNLYFKKVFSVELSTKEIQKVEVGFWGPNDQMVTSGTANEIAERYIFDQKNINFLEMVIKNFGKKEILYADIFYKGEITGISFADKNTETDLIVDWVEKSYPQAKEFLKEVGIDPPHDIEFSFEQKDPGTNKEPVLYFVKKNETKYKIFVSWKIDGKEVAMSEGTIPTVSPYGESSYSLDIVFGKDSVWHFLGAKEDPILILTTAPSNQIFESVYFEILHKITHEQSFENIMDDLNKKKETADASRICQENIHYEEVYVHYVGICLLNHLRQMGLYPGDNLTDFSSKYGGHKRYEGLMPLLKKYPPSLENAKRIRDIFVNSPEQLIYEP